MRVSFWLTNQINPIPFQRFLFSPIISLESFAKLSNRLLFHRINYFGQRNIFYYEWFDAFVHETFLPRHAIYSLKKRKKLTERRKQRTKNGRMIKYRAYSSIYRTWQVVHLAKLYSFWSKDNGNHGQRVP